MSKRPAAKSQRSGSKADKAGSNQKPVRRDALAEKFIAVDTGRVIKSSPAKPHLGKKRIQTAVRGYVRRDS